MGIMEFLEAMGTSNIPLLAAFFIGLLMAIAPCPMATNIAELPTSPAESETVHTRSGWEPCTASDGWSPMWGSPF